MNDTFTDHHTTLTQSIEEDSQTLIRDLGRVIYDLDTFTAYIFVLSDINNLGERSEPVDERLVEINHALQASVTDLREAMRFANQDDLMKVNRYCESDFRRVTRSLELLKETT